MIRLCAGFRAILAIIALCLCIGPASAQAPPAEIKQLIEILSDPDVRAWLDAQAKPAVPAAAAPEAAMMSSMLAAIRAHGHDMIRAFQGLPAEFARAKVILLSEFQERGLFVMAALIAGFIAAGIGLDQLLRSQTGGYRAWMKAIPTTNPAGRLRGLGARLLYATMMIAAFVIGSVGVFLLFEWPPLLREIVLAFLTVAIIVRVALMLCRVALVPPFLGLPNPANYRIVVMTDARATHWYRWVGLLVGWFAFVGAWVGLMQTFGFDEPARLAVGAAAGLVQLLLVLAALWLRPVDADTPHRRISPRAASWLLTVFFVTLWLMRVGGLYTAFWLLFAVVALPAAIAATRAAVHHILRAPDDGTEPFPEVTIAVIDRGLRVCLIVISAFLLAQAWGISMAGMAAGESLAERLLRGGLNAAVILLAADFGWSVIKAMIARRLGADAPHGIPGEDHPVDVDPKQARLRTLLPIVQNILFAALVVMSVMMVLSALGIDIAPLIAGAGVVGVAIGFGAQTVVKDIISGMFFLLDDAFRVGEYIETGTHKGSVESFSLRSVKLRHHRGPLTTVPFGELGAVQNMSRDWVIDKFTVTVGYKTDMEVLRKLIKKLGAELAADPEYAPHVIEQLKMQGVQSFGDYGISVGLKMTMRPGQQFQMRRRAYVRLKQLFEENGIEIPFPTVHVQGAGTEAAETAATAYIADKAAKAAVATPAP